ncbi:MAG: hypothetical protein E5W39_13185, partial [Mesorhizobium sp.]
GRRAALRSLWGNPWKFESSRPHQLYPISCYFITQFSFSLQLFPSLFVQAETLCEPAAGWARNAAR